MLRLIQVDMNTLVKINQVKFSPHPLCVLELAETMTCMQVHVYIENTCTQLKKKE